jgi:hypothetical protein
MAAKRKEELTRAALTWERPVCADRPRASPDRTRRAAIPAANNAAASESGRRTQFRGSIL